MQHFIISAQDAALITKAVDKNTTFIHFTVDGQTLIGTDYSRHTINTAQSIDHDIVITDTTAFNRKLKKAVALDKKANIIFTFSESKVYGVGSSISFYSASYKNVNPTVEFYASARSNLTYFNDLNECEEVIYSGAISQGIIKMLPNDFTIELSNDRLEIYADAKITYEIESSSFVGRLYVQSEAMNTIRKAIHKDSDYRFSVYVDADQENAVIEISTDDHSFMINCFSCRSEEYIKAIELEVKQEAEINDSKLASPTEKQILLTAQTLKALNEHRKRSKEAVYSLTEITKTEYTLKTLYKQLSQERKVMPSHYQALKPYSNNSEVTNEANNKADCEVNDEVHNQVDNQVIDLSCIGIETKVIDQEKLAAEAKRVTEANRSIKIENISGCNQLLKQSIASALKKDHDYGHIPF